MIDIPISVTSGCAGFAIGSVLSWCLKKRLGRIAVILRHSTNPDKLQTKMVLVVRTDINMKPGKVASQCAHAAVACYQASSTRNPELTRIWEAVGQPKVVLRCSGETTFYSLESRATKHKLIHALIKDAGRTELQPGTKTVLGIGPGKVEDVDAVTGHLKLY